MNVHEVKSKIEPTILVIFGATGDLARRFLMPALYHLARQKLLPKYFRVVGFARRELSEPAFRQEMEKAIRQFSKKEFNRQSWQGFAKNLHYRSGDINEQSDFRKISRLLGDLESVEARKDNHFCANRLFYFATLPKLHEKISRELKKSGLLIGCGDHERTIRAVVEKPFGRDLASARQLDRSLNKYFSEQQIYRIDHYLGKETVQNMLAARFANAIFEPIWNHNYIDHVQISALESLGMEGRGAFYDQTGALRDFAQNHIMQLLSLTAMEAPEDLSTKSIRDERAKVIKAIRLPKKSEISKMIAAGQYGGYSREKNVGLRSRTETFIALKLYIDNSRWAGVPFYVRTGKKLKENRTEISIHFKKPAQFLFEEKEIAANVLTFIFKPREGIYLQMMAKQPGFGIRLHPVKMELGYRSVFSGEIPGAYERLLLDFMQGDQRLFARSDEIEYSWKYIDAVEKYLQKRKPEIYVEGSWGPKGAEQLIQKDHRKWHI